jgi:antitoxin component of MazEF toxin-antitoxin module
MTSNTVKLRKRGNGLWITIPAAIVKKMNLRLGEEVQLTAIWEDGFELTRIPKDTATP